MQSTKKAPLRKEEGAAVTGDDAVTIAQSTGAIVTPVRFVIHFMPLVLLPEIPALF